MHEAANSGIQPRWVGVGYASLGIWQSVRAEQQLTNMRDRLVINSGLGDAAKRHA